MFKYLLILSVRCGAVFAATFGSLNNSPTPFTKVENGKWQNTSFILHSSDFLSSETLLENLLIIYGNDDFLEFGNLVGMEIAIDSLELDNRATDALYSYFNITKMLNKRQDVYQEEIPTHQVYEGSPSRRCRNMDRWASWMRCCVATYYSKATVYSCAVVEYIYGTLSSPAPYKAAWKFAGSGHLGNSLGVIGIGSAFKSNDAQKKCTSSFLVVNEKFELVSASGKDDPVFLFGVIPKNLKGGNCRTATPQSDIQDMAAILLQEAMKGSMAAFCLSITGQPG